MAELALALAGFSGVMTAFMKRPGKLTRVEGYRIAVLLGVSFGATLLALLPIVLQQVGVEGARRWAVSSAFMVAYSAVALGVFLASSRQVARQAPEIFNWYILGTVALGHVVNVALQLVNAAHAGAALAPGIYTLGVLWYLIHAAVQFTRMVFVQPTD